MSKFGWSYPPGCSGGPYDGASDPSALQEAVLELLEAAGIDTATNDKIMALIEVGEIKNAEAANSIPECHCDWDMPKHSFDCPFAIAARVKKVAP